VPLSLRRDADEARACRDRRTNSVHDPDTLLRARKRPLAGRSHPAPRTQAKSFLSAYLTATAFPNRLGQRSPGTLRLGGEPRRGRAPNGEGGRAPEAHQRTATAFRAHIHQGGVPIVLDEQAGVPAVARQIGHRRGCQPGRREAICGRGRRPARGRRLPHRHSHEGRPLHAVPVHRLSANVAPPATVVRFQRRRPSFNVAASEALAREELMPAEQRSRHRDGSPHRLAEARGSTGLPRLQ
jgi:hypothetical protein